MVCWKGCLGDGEGNAERLTSLFTFLLLSLFLFYSKGQHETHETRLFLNLRFLMKWFQRSLVSLTYISPLEPDLA